MNNRRIAQVGVPVAAIAIVATGLLLLSSRSQPQQRPPQIEAKFLGLTNDASGVQFGRFSVKNADARKVHVSLPGFVDLGRRGGGWFYTNALFSPGITRETWIEAPTNRRNWRAVFLCRFPESWPHQFRNWAIQHGWPGTFVVSSTEHIYSDWATNEKFWTDPAAFLTNSTPASELDLKTAR